MVSFIEVFACLLINNLIFYSIYKIYLLYEAYRKNTEITRKINIGSLIANYGNLALNMFKYLNESNNQNAKVNPSYPYPVHENKDKLYEDMYDESSSEKSYVDFSKRSKSVCSCACSCASISDLRSTNRCSCASIYDLISAPCYHSINTQTKHPFNRSKSVFNNTSDVSYINKTCAHAGIRVNKNISKCTLNKIFDENASCNTRIGNESNNSDSTCADSTWADSTLADSTCANSTCADSTSDDSMSDNIVYLHTTQKSFLPSAKPPLESYKPYKTDSMEKHNDNKSETTQPMDNMHLCNNESEKKNDRSEDETF